MNKITKLDGYTFQEMSIRGLYDISIMTSQDERGQFFKEYSYDVFDKVGIEFVPSESMIICSKKNVLRGLHFQQTSPQTRLVRCVEGLFFVVIVDLRYNSETFGKCVETNLGGNKEFLVPKGCALGTLAMCDSVLFCAFDGKHYDEYSSGIIWNDSELNIQWPIGHNEVIISARDSGLVTLKELKERYETDNKISNQYLK